MSTQTIDDEPSIGQILAGKYEVLGLLGRGGMGLVVEAKHIHLGQNVAIKLLRPEVARDPTALARFMREAKAVAALRSEHVAHIMDIGALESGAPYLVMEHLSGSTLARVCREKRRISAPEAIDYVLQICDALAEAHALGIVHRDLKPANIFVTTRHDGSTLVKVLDFGISKIIAEGKAEGPTENLTETGVIIGSPDYASPEQIRSSRRVDTRSDIWSLGVLLYRLIAGAPPFRSPTTPGIFIAIIHDPPAPLPSDLDASAAALGPVIARCLEKDPAKRLQTVGDLVRELLPFASEGGRPRASWIGRVSMSDIDAPKPSERAEARTSAAPSAPSMPMIAAPTPEPSTESIPTAVVVRPNDTADALLRGILRSLRASRFAPIAIAFGVLFVVVVVGLLARSGDPIAPANRALGSLVPSMFASALPPPATAAAATTATAAPTASTARSSAPVAEQAPPRPPPKPAKVRWSPTGI